MTEDQSGRKDMANVAVSIIIPIYNMERYLSECLDSVCGQTFQNLEIICIDDGSTDCSPEIIDACALKDRRIKVLHKQNSGYGDSVNQGMDLASGKYIGIVEPDDRIAADMYETLYSVAEVGQLDVVRGNYVEFYGMFQEGQFRKRKLLDNSKLYNQLIAPRSHPEIFRTAIANWTGIYRNDFLKQHEIRHNTTPGASFQDAGFWFQVMVQVQKLMFVDHDCYFYRRDNPNSSTASGVNNLDKLLGEYRYIYGMLQNRPVEAQAIMPVYYRRKYLACRHMLSRVGREYWKEVVERIAQELSVDDAMFGIERFDLPESILREMAVMMASPQTFCASLYHLGTELHEKLLPYDSFVIYGAGEVGKRVVNELLPEDLGKCCGFCVTGEPEASAYLHMPVKNFRTYAAQKEIIAVVVAVSDQFQGDILKVLEREAFHNVITLDSFLTKL